MACEDMLTGALFSFERMRILLLMVIGVFLLQSCSSSKHLPNDPMLVHPVLIKDKYGFINSSGDVVVEPTYDSLAWYSLYPIAVETDSGWGYIDKYGEVLFRPQFQAVFPFIDGRAWYRFQFAYGLLAEDGRLLADAFYYNRSRFRQGYTLNDKGAAQKCVVLDTAGNSFDPGFCFGEHNDGIGVFYDKGYYGFATLEGRLILDATYKQASYFSEGLAPVAMDSTHYGYIDTSGAWIIEPRFKLAYPFSNGVARVLALNNKWTLINRRGDFLVQPKYDRIMDFVNGLANVAVTQRGNMIWGIMDTTGAEVVVPQYRFIGTFSEGLAPVTNLSGKYGFVTRDGEVAIEPTFFNARSFSEGLASFREGKTMGVIDRTGTVVVEAEYYDIGPFYNGVAMATRGGSIPDFFKRKPGIELVYINRKNKVIFVCDP